MAGAQPELRVRSAKNANAFLAAQRDGAAASLRRADISAHPVPELTDWRVADFPEEDVLSMALTPLIALASKRLALQPG